MKNFLKNIKKRTIIIAIIIAVVASFFGYNKFFKVIESGYDFATVERGNILQEVNVTGRVKPAQEVDLAFEKSGRIAWTTVKIGDRAYIGQTLVSLENSDISAQLAQAKANVKIQQAKLDELKDGTRPEEIKVYEVKVDNAKNAVVEDKKDVINKLQDAYTKADDSVRNYTDQLFTNPRSSDPQIDLEISLQLETDIETGRVVLENLFSEWKLSLDTLIIESELNQYVVSTKNNLDEIKEFLEDIAFAVNSLESSSSLSQATINGYKTDISTARTGVNTAITNLLTAEEGLKTAESALSLAEQELELKKAGSRPEELFAQEATVEEAEASVNKYKADLSKTYITAPINGVITKQDAKIGEIVSANTILVSLISASQFEIEVNVPEADIAKIEIGDSAKVTLDAYGNDVPFNAKVTKIDPAETIIEGVPTYKTTLQFIEKDDRVRSGMTANIDVLTATLEDVIVVPQRAVITKNGDKIVRVLKEDSSDRSGELISEVVVKTGLRGSEGTIEILEGIKEGDRVVIFVK